MKMSISLSKQHVMPLIMDLGEEWIPMTGLDVYSSLLT